MRQIDGTYKCRVCGATVDVPYGQIPRAEIQATSGKLNVHRLVVCGGREMHRCELPDAKINVFLAW